MPGCTTHWIAEENPDALFEGPRGFPVAGDRASVLIAG